MLVKGTSQSLAFNAASTHRIRVLVLSAGGLKILLSSTLHQPVLRMERKIPADGKQGASKMIRVVIAEPGWIFVQPKTHFREHQKAE
jgi:hypothetical protein